MRDESRGRILLFAAAVMAAAGGFAFSPIPKDSAKALGVTRGKPFSSGVVFVDGKYVEPPYVVERWGTGIRINKIPVTGQLISWNEFLKTQDGVKIEKKVVMPAAPESESEPPKEVESEPPKETESEPPKEAESEPEKEPDQPKQAATASDVDVSSLDELFGDSPTPEKPKPSEEPKRPSPPPKASPAEEPDRPKTPPVAPKTVTTYTLSGEFRRNAASRALLKRINASRTEIDKTLRAGGFICFGSKYMQVTGDKRILLLLLESLPGIQQRSESIEAFRAGVRAANLVFLNESLCDDLFRNRLDYRKLQERRELIKSERNGITF